MEEMALEQGFKDKGIRTKADGTAHCHIQVRDNEGLKEATGN